MFKNLAIFKISLDDNPLPSHEHLKEHAFAPGSPTQEVNVGWIPPREQNGLFVERISGHLVAKFCIETRSVPAEAIKRLVADQAAQIEASTGRKPGKKERKELAEEARLTLLPHAFPKLSTHLVWIDYMDERLCIDVPSHAKADRIITLLVQSVPGLVVTDLVTNKSPQVLMWQLLKTEPGDVVNGFSVGRTLELSGMDEGKAKIRYDNIDLRTEEILDHINHGRHPTKVGCNYDDAVDLVLTDKLMLKKIIVDDVSMSQVANKEDLFDADFALFTGELRPLIDSLILALGGEVVEAAE